MTTYYSYRKAGNLLWTALSERKFFSQTGSNQTVSVQKQYSEVYSLLMNSLRTFIRISLITLALVGVQVIQASPLHDHSDHVVDCGLCHFSFSEIAVDDSPASTLTNIPRHYAVPDAVRVASEPVRLAYQGRAPPRFNK